MKTPGTIIFNNGVKKDNPDKIPVPDRNPEIIPPQEPQPDIWPKKEPETQPGKEPATVPPGPSQIPVPGQKNY